MALDNRRQVAERYGLAASQITLRHFTPESVSTFLRAVSHKLMEDIVPKAGPSPWMPNLHPDHRGSLTAPSGDNRGPYMFAALTHMQVIRTLVAADPANIADTATVMEVAADSDNQRLRLLMLRIALRLNHAMILETTVDGKKLLTTELLILEHDAPVIPEFGKNTPLPATTVNSDVMIVDENGGETPAFIVPAVVEQPAPVQVVHQPAPVPVVVPEQTSTPTPQPTVEPQPAPVFVPEPVAPPVVKQPLSTPEPVTEQPVATPAPEPQRVPVPASAPTENFSVTTANTTSGTAKTRGASSLAELVSNKTALSDDEDSPF